MYTLNHTLICVNKNTFPVDKNIRQTDLSTMLTFWVLADMSKIYWALKHHSLNPLCQVANLLFGFVWWIPVIVFYIPINWHITKWWEWQAFTGRTIYLSPNIKTKKNKWVGHQTVQPCLGGLYSPTKKIFFA